MKNLLNIILSVFSILTASMTTATAQNTFPASGNVGIGTTNPAASLSFVNVNASDNPTGITWYNDADATYYGIHRTGGPWSPPNYQQIRIGWQTGIVLDPGSSYGASYVNIIGGGLRVTAGTVKFPVLALDNTQTKIVTCSTDGTLYLRDAYTLGGSGSGWALTGNTTVNPATTFLGTTDNTPLAFRTNNAERMRVDINGNVLIGKTSQSNTGYILDVNGIARITKIVVNTTGADYVFDPARKLLPLPAIEKYIQAHHHLPDIAPADEMKVQGMDIGSQQTLLLQKVEELTLYLIEQAKQQKEQDKKIKILQLENHRLQQQLDHHIKPAKAK
ncbi:MAG TPA: hypothetical protein VE035_04465 [Puia sp.]|nr:hypothetical protein [Puia sp.]